MLFVLVEVARGSTFNNVIAALGQRPVPRELAPLLNSMDLVVRLADEVKARFQRATLHTRAVVEYRLNGQRKTHKLRDEDEELPSEERRLESLAQKVHDLVKLSSMVGANVTKERRRARKRALAAIGRALRNDGNRDLRAQLVLVAKALADQANLELQLVRDGDAGLASSRTTR